MNLKQDTPELLRCANNKEPDIISAQSIKRIQCNYNRMCHM